MLHRCSLRSSRCLHRTELQTFSKQLHQLESIHSAGHVPQRSIFPSLRPGASSKPKSYRGPCCASTVTSRSVSFRVVSSTLNDAPFSGESEQPEEWPDYLARPKQSASTNQWTDPSDLFEPADANAVESNSPYTSDESLLRRARDHLLYSELSEAWNLIREYVFRGGDPVSSTLFNRTANLFLRKATRTDKNYDNTSDILANLMDLNFSPDRDTFNILIRNATYVGDAAAAWQVYDSVLDYGFEPDDIMYCRLLFLCRKTNDLDAFKRLYYKHINPASRTELDPKLLTELLMSNIWLHKHGAYHIGHALKIYERFADIQPLKDIGILPANYTSSLSIHQHSPPNLPSASTLHVMISLYLCPNNVDIDIIDSVYRNFLQRIEARDPCFLTLLHDPHIWASFLKAMSRWPATFGIPNQFRNENDQPDVRPHLEWRAILKTMTAPPPPDLLNPETSRPIPRRRPNKYHWTIIANSYARAGCYDEAEGLLQLMHDQNITPGIATWNALIGAASIHQDMEYVTSLLYRVVQNDIRVDGTTVQMLSHLDDSERLKSWLSQVRANQGPDTPDEPPRCSENSQQFLLDVVRDLELPSRG